METLNYDKNGIQQALQMLDKLKVDGIQNMSYIVYIHSILSNPVQKEESAETK